MGSSADALLATDVSLLLAIPALVPAVVVAGVVFYIARKDRADERAERELLERGSDDPAS